MLERQSSSIPSFFVKDTQGWMMVFSIFPERSRAITPAKGGVNPTSSRVVATFV